jgi:crossover junction endodeoxyribonuclease RuvC
MKHYMGIDPGYSGAIVVIDEDGGFVGSVRLSATEHDVSSFVIEHAPMVSRATLERVSAMPRQGVASTFKFGTSYGFCRALLVCGFCRALLVCHQIRFETVTPATWQGVMKCRSKGDKNVTKAAAQRLFPAQKVVHATADAMLIAEYTRRAAGS